MLLLAACCHAQGFPGESMSEEAARAPGGRYLAGLETDVIGKDDAIRWQGFDIVAGAPLLTGRQRSLFLTGKVRYLGLDNRRNTLPPRLIAGSIGAFGSFAVGDVTLKSFVSLAVRSDQPTLHWDAISLIASFGVEVPIDDEWSITPSVFFSTAVRDTGGFSFRYIPLPDVAFGWEPSDSFRLEFSARSAKLRWTPEKWLSIEAGYTFPFGGSLRISEKPADWLRVIQFFGQYSDRYVLQDDRWSRNHLIKIQGFAAGVTHEFLIPLGGGTDAPVLAIGVTYAVAVGGKLRVWNYVEDDELFELKAEPSHTFGASVSLVFGTR
ncbi:MAG: hypothetical protein H6839_17030 [Planctomycetes bacterium]|nr:hypothetical protein [Planctomycetota bacterium]